MWGGLPGRARQPHTETLLVGGFFCVCVFVFFSGIWLNKTFNLFLFLFIVDSTVAPTTPLYSLNPASTPFLSEKLSTLKVFV